MLLRAPWRQRPIRLSLLVLLPVACAGSPKLHSSLASYSRSIPGEAEPRLEYFDADLSSRIADGTGRLQVFTEPRDDAAAADALALLVEMDRHIATLLGGPPPAFRLFLHVGSDAARPLRLVVGVSGEPSAFPLPVAAGRLDAQARWQIVRLMSHEWIEQAVLHHYLPFDLYQLDPATRWVGDGIAELVSLLVLARFGVEGGPQAMLGERIADVTRTSQGGLGEVRLAEWLRDEGPASEMLAGQSASDAARSRAHYAACLALWWCCFEQRQEELLPAFFARVRALPRDRVDGAECARVLGRLTGVDASAMLADWALADVLVVLERANRKLAR